MSEDIMIVDENEWEMVENSWLICLKKGMDVCVVDWKRRIRKKWRKNVRNGWYL